LITNSDYEYTNRMMSHAYDRYLEDEGMKWRDLFDMVSPRLHFSPLSARPAAQLLNVDPVIFAYHRFTSV
jgi:hypothetical protein